VLKLTIEDDEGKTTVIPVIRDEMTIGRQEGNTIRLTEQNVSRRHARLLRQNGVVYVEDLASFTGVKLNGARINAVTPIREGDELHIGDYKIVLKSDRPAEAANPASQTKLKSGRTATPAMGSRTTPAAAATMVTSPSPVTAFSSSASLPRANGTAIEPGTAAARSSAPEPLEGQPTIPVRTLGEMAAKNDAAPAPARLVVLSTELAGMEFMLGRASVVVGRTDENDIQLNHRSISRHHAKIVRDNDRYTIVDLQSANGVRVNGDDYERIELNPADIVELGHVKMRFVGPFELYVFDPAAAAKLHERKPQSKVVFTVAGAVLSVVALLVLQRLMSRPKPPSGMTVAIAPLSAPVNAAPTTAPAPAAEAATTPPPLAGTPAGTGAATGPVPTEPFAKIIRDAQNEDWTGALATIRQLNAGGLTQTPLTPAERTRLLELFRKAETERKGSAAFAKFDEASGAKDYGGAIDWFEAIPPESMYKKRAAPRYQEARTLFVSEHLLAAEKFRTQGKCIDTRREADEVGKVDPNNQLVKELVKLCKPAPGGTLVAAAAAPHVPRSRVLGSVGAVKETPRASEAPPPARAVREPARSVEPAAPAVAASGGAEASTDPDALMKQARDAWLHQQCGSAIDIARRALKSKPSLTDAYQIITVCSCSLRDAEGAGRAYGKLDDKSRTLARSLCQKNGISLGGE
jgi:pSer/pThr/pTyr-binding forkhead associated (FHA) protein